MKMSVGILNLLGLVGMSLGCGKSPSGPTPLAPVTTVSPNAELTVTTISPTRGLTGESVRVAGIGFLPGATVLLDGVPARITGFTSTLITATTPAHTAGTVDVVVTNPGGQSGTLIGSYTFEIVILTVTPNRVAPEGQLSVSWAVPSGRSRLDWIALFKVMDPNTSYQNGWWQYTYGAASGTLTLPAPTQPGEYEFRYLADDGFIDGARIPVTVVGS
jgi:hypothetical protein